MTPAARNRLVVLLAVHSGITDAVGFVALGGAFTSVMTGNMVLLGLSAVRTDGTLAARVATAIACFMAGAGIGARIAGRPRPGDPTWPAAVGRALAVELVVTLAYAAGWEAAGGHPRGWPQLGLLAANAVGLGVQSSAILRFGVSGLSTTYMTGTLTTTVQRLATGDRPRDVGHSLAILAGLLGGAVAGGWLVLHAPRVVPIVSVALVASVLMAGRRAGGAEATGRETAEAGGAEPAGGALRGTAAP